MSGFFTGPRIAFGPGAVEQIGGLNPRRIACVVAASVCHLDPVRRAQEQLVATGASVETWEAHPQPATIAEVERMGRRIAALAPDTVVAIGGGSLLDAAKGIVARLARPDLELAALTPLAEIDRPARPQFVAIPTTSGSGSEATGAAYLYAEDGSTLEVIHRELTPDWAFVDPTFARTLPAAAAIDAGVEVVAHALEALASEWANPFSDALGRDALAVGLAELPRLAHRPRDENARTALHYAATKAGLAIGNSSLGLTHAIARSLVPETGLTYGRLSALALAVVVDFNFPSARDRYQSVAPLFSAAFGNARTSGLSEQIRAMIASLGLPSTLSATGVDLSAFGTHRARIIERVRRSSAAIANPRVPSATEVERLLALIADGEPRLTT